MKLSRHRRDEPSPDAADAAESGPDPEDLAFAHGLASAGRITPEQLAQATHTSEQPGGPRLTRALVMVGALDEHGLARALAEHYRLDLADLRTATPQPDAVAALPEITARTLVALPLRLVDGRLVVAVAEPRSSSAARLAAAVGSEVTVAVAPRDELTRAIDRTYRALAGVDTTVAAFEARDSIRRDAARTEAVVASDDAPVVQVVQAIITQGLRDRASDIHVEPGADRVRVRYRIDGALHDVLDLPASIGPGLVSRVKILGGMNIVERRRPQDGQISMDIEDRAVDIRVSTTSVVGGEKVVMRLLDKSRPLFHLDQLGMPDHISSRYRTLLGSPYGMVVCAGPTGSGKTTTLYGSLNEINSPERNVMTIEDPVEYTFDSINQIQINEQAGITFANGLRSILRQDPDVILVGEVRDVETARIAIQSALTGHLVLSSVHATDSVSALHRLMDMGIEGFLIASSITAVLAQRLVRRICSYCSETYQPSAEEIAYLDHVGAGHPVEFLRGAGCNFCANTGYLERIGVYELMPVDDEVRQMILERASHDDLRKAARAGGMTTLQEEAVRLVREGITDVPDVLRSIYVMGA